jgi:ribosomal protein S18 acetylase RimI-like enzyme
MKKFDYIIAFYLGPRRSTFYTQMTTQDKFFLIKKHLGFLRKNHKNMPLNKVYFVFNENDFSKNLYFDILKLVEDYGLTDLVDVDIRNNQGFSYGAWQHVLIKNIQQELKVPYAFLCEDDYLPTSNEFYKPFYNKLTLPEIGYVAELVWDHPQIHAAISNGFIKYDVVKEIYNTKGQIFTLDTGDTYYTGVFNQVHFTDLIQTNYTLSDISDDCKIPFYEVSKEDLIYYGNSEGKIVIEPITSAIDLEPLKEEHLEFLLEVRNDDSTRNFLGNNSKFSLKEAKEWFKTLESEWFIIKYSEEMVGYMRTTINGEIGLDIHPNYRRKGFARIAYLKYLSNKKFATLWVFEDNFALNLYTELGFKPTGNITKVRDRDYTQMYYVKE